MNPMMSMHPMTQMNSMNQMGQMNPMDSFIVNALEKRFGLDLNGDGYIGGPGRMAMLETRFGMDINGDGILGRMPDVVPGYPAVYGYPSMVYGPGGQIYATNKYVAPRPYTYF